MVAPVLIAHAGHYVWLLFVLPIAIVIWFAARSIILTRRETRAEREPD